MPSKIKISVQKGIENSAQKSQINTVVFTISSVVYTINSAVFIISTVDLRFLRTFCVFNHPLHKIS